MWIRDAKVDDIDWLMEQVRDFAKFYGTKANMAGNEEYGRKYLKHLMGYHFFKIAETQSGVRAGFIVGLISKHHFNPDLEVMTELLWWVPENLRHTGAGKKLFDAFMEYGENNVNLISFTLEDNTPLEDEFLLKRGFRLKERAFIKECK